MKPAWMCLPPALLAAFLGAIVTPADARAYACSPHELGDYVTLGLKDGRVLAGAWRGPLGSLYHNTDYAKRYEAWRGPWGSFSAPALDDSVTVTRKSGEPVTGEFQGFAGGAVLIATGDRFMYRMLKLDDVAD